MCPYCGRRWSGSVEPDCLICAGEGVLDTGAAGVGRFGAEVTARAVENALEGRARNSMARLAGPAPIVMSQARASLRLCVLELRAAGLLQRRAGDRAAAARLAVFTAARDLGATPLVEVGEWFADDRPRSGGGGPGFDLAFYLCDLRLRPAGPVLTAADHAWANAGRLPLPSPAGGAAGREVGGQPLAVCDEAHA